MLVRYYHAFVASRDQDPTGEATLLQVLGERDMTTLQRKWVEYVAKLTFP